MKSSSYKEKIILLCGTIGIGLVSLGITLTVYNAEISKPNNTPQKEITRIVYDDGLTDEQRKVAQNLVDKLNEIEEEKNNTNEVADTIPVKIDKEVNTKTDVKKDESNTVSTQTEEKDENYTEKIVEAIAKVRRVSFIKPIDGKLGMIFSDEKLVYSETLEEWITHKALDILADEGTNVKAAEDGVIKEMYDDKKYGYTIVIEHDDGYLTKYAGVIKNDSIKIGQEVKQGDVISNISAPVGFEVDEGSHLHFEVLKDSINIEPEFI